jgi:ABC-2 type transport system permease protein
MNNIQKYIALEWLKFGANRPIRIGLILYIALFIGGYFAFREIAKVSANPVVNMSSLTEFPLIWGLNGYIGNWLAFFILGYIGIQLISIEFSSKTFRQNIISGLHRKEFLYSKFSSAVLLSGAANIVYGILSVVLGLLFTEDKSMITEGTIFPSIGYFFVMNLGHILLAMMITMAVRKGSVALFVYFLYGMFIENIIRWSLHNKVLQNSISMHFYPFNVLEDMTPLPYFDKISKMGSTEMQLTLDPHVAFIGALVYIGIYVFIMFRLATRKDI